MKETGYIILLAGCLTFSSCDKLTVPDDSLNDVFGHWILYQELSTWGGTYYEPDQRFVSISITDFGKYYQYYDNEETQERSYTFVHGSEINADDAYYIEFNGMNMEFDNHLRITQYAKDTLLLSDSWTDGYTYYYLRDQ